MYRQRPNVCFLLLLLTVAVPTSAQTELPALLKPGLRITWEAGDSVVHGVEAVMKEVEKGKWINPKTGKQYNPEETRNSGGNGFAQLDLVHVAPDLVIADVRTYLLTDAGNGLAASASGATALLGNGEALGEYWAHPARLAKLEEGRAADGSIIWRLAHKTKEKQYDAIGVRRESPSNYLSLIYDRETGLLLSKSGCVIGENVFSARRDTPEGAGRGAATISHARFLGARETKVPWAAEPAPPWAKQGIRLDYQGSYNLVTQTGGPLPGMGITFSYAIERGAGAAVIGNMVTRTDIGGGLPPQESMSPRCYGSTSLGGLWISPAGVRQLQPNQLIDEDPVTRFRTTFAGAHGNAIVFVEQGPLQMTHFTYDAASGILRGIQATQQMGNFSQRQTSLTLVGGR